MWVVEWKKNRRYSAQNAVAAIKHKAPSGKGRKLNKAEDRVNLTFEKKCSYYLVSFSCRKLNNMTRIGFLTVGQTL